MIAIIVRCITRIRCFLFAEGAQPIPAFQRQVHINPPSDGGEINQVFDEIIIFVDN